LDTTTRPGLLGSARGVLAALLEMAHTRLQLASTELEEERLRLAVLLLYATAALFFLGVGIVLASMLLVVLLWEDHRILVLAVLTSTFLSIGAGLALAWRRRSIGKPPLLSTTIEELRRDEQALRHIGPGSP
jgi:uncharacterized membrane protein YqjE